MTVLYYGRKGQRSSTSRHSWSVLGGFVLLAAGLSWPLIAHLSSRLPGTATWAFDESTFAWNIWYFKHALLDLHANPLHAELIWFPLGIDLILYTYNFFNALVALPLQLLANVPLASNLTLLLATVLSGFGTYLLAMYLLHPTGEVREAGPRFLPLAGRAAAVLAGIIYAFASNRAIYAALGHYNMVTTQWVPFYTLYLLKTLRERGTKHAIMAALFFVLAALTDMQYAAFLGLFSLVLVLALWRQLPSLRQALARLCLTATLALLFWSPVLIPIAREFLTDAGATSGWGESVKLSADLAGWFTPTDLNPLVGPAAAARRQDLARAAESPTAAEQKPGAWEQELRAVEESRGRFGDINTVFLGYATVGLALLGAWQGRSRVRAWTWSAVIFGILTLGPLLQIAGRYRFSVDNLLPEGVTFPLPFALLHFIPFINGNRAPNRNSTVLMLALAVLAAFGAAWLLQRVGEWGSGRMGERENGRHSPTLPLSHSPILFLSALLSLALIVEHLAIPLPTTDARVPEVYRQIAAEPGDFSILQLPLGWRDSFGVLGSERTQLQYYQTVHGKAIIGGNISRAPAFKMDYFRRIPLFRALTDLELYKDVSPEVDAAARSQAGALMALYDVRYLIAFPPVQGGYPYQDTWQRTEAYALSVLPVEPQPFWQQDGIRAYRVLQPSIPYPFRLTLGSAGIEPYVGDGWDLAAGEQPYGAAASWITDTVASLYLPLAGPTGTTLRLAIAPLSYAAAPAQTVSISVNGVPLLSRAALAQGWQTLTVPVPASATRRGPNHVQMTFAWAQSPRRVFPDAASRAVIGETGLVSPVNLEVHSFQEAYISAVAADGSETKASVGRRGYNVAVIDPGTGRLLDRQGFDTAANPYEADRLAAYLTGLKPGQIVVLGTKENATAHLTPALIAALRGVGSRVNAEADLRGQAHALIGVTGAAAGTAAETIKAGDAFLRVGGDFRRLAAAVQWVELAP